MKTKEVRDEFGIIRLVDEEKRKIYDYCNFRKIVTWNAPIVEDGQDSHSWCLYQEKGTIEEIEKRMQTWRNGVKLAYAVVVGFNASKNDPEKIIWNRIVKYVSSHPTEFFDQWGDWKKDLTIDNDKIRKMGE